MTPAALHPDAGRVLDADAGRLALTHDEADRIALEASYLEDDHPEVKGGFLGWVEYVLQDVRTGARDRNGRRKW